jgi:ABC-type glycerol-3-phosphate transport system substrate-binding protein
MCPVKSQLFITLVISLGLLFTACNLPGFAPTSNLFSEHSTTPTVSILPSAIPSPTATETVVQGTVTIWHSWAESEMPGLVQIIADFNVLYPNIYFDVLYIPQEELRSHYENETRNGAGPTLLFGPADWGPSLYDQGLVAKLDDRIDPALISQLNKPGLGQGRYKESLISLPYAISGVVLFRNKDIITLSANTLDELIMLAQSSTQGEIIGAILERSFLYSGAHLEGLGGQLMDMDGFPTFNDEKGVAWLEMLKLFDQAGPTSFMSNQDLSYFQEGRVGWIIDGTWNMPDIAEAIGAEKLAIDPWPHYQDGALSGYVISDMLFLNINARDDQATSTLKFIEYLLSPPAQTFLTDINQIPSNLTINPPETLTQTLISQAMVALAGGSSYPIAAEMDIYSASMDTGLRSYFDENLIAQDILQTLVNTIREAILERRAQTPTP